MRLALLLALLPASALTPARPALSPQAKGS